MSATIWKAIPGFEGLYDVSSAGIVRGVGRGRILKTSLDRGYPKVRLAAAGKRFTRRVASLVCLAFIGPRPAGLQVCHRDGRRANSAAANLYYGTPQQNAADALRHGTRRQGETIPWAKLDEATVRSIRTNPEQLSQSALARRHGTAPSTINRIQRGKRWKHVA